MGEMLGLCYSFIGIPYICSENSVVRELKYTIILLPYTGAGVGKVEVVVIDPKGRKDTVPCHIEDRGSNSYRCTYKPTQEGAYTIHITFAGSQIPKSPYSVTVGGGK